MYIDIYVYIHTSLRIYIHRYVCKCIPPCRFLPQVDGGTEGFAVYIYLCISVHIWYIHTHIYIYIYICIILSPFPPQVDGGTEGFAGLYTSVHIYIHLYTSIYLYDTLSFPASGRRRHRGLRWPRARHVPVRKRLLRVHAQPLPATAGARVCIYIHTYIYTYI